MAITVFGEIVTAGVTVLAGRLLVKGFRSGNMVFREFGGFTYSGNRQHQPIKFWLIAGVIALLTLFAAILTIAPIVMIWGFGWSSK